MSVGKRDRREYSKEFKFEAVEMAESESYTATEVAENLGIPIANLRRWIRQYREDASNAFPGKGHQLPEQEAMRKLQRENTGLHQERDILKKALGIFPRQK